MAGGNNAMMTRNAAAVGIILIIFIALLSFGNAKSVNCTVKCNLVCIFIRKPLCVTDCLKRCKFQVSEAISNCTFLCTKSSCTKFTSGSDTPELQRCVSSCYGNCSENENENL